MVHVSITILAEIIVAVLTAVKILAVHVPEEPAVKLMALLVFVPVLPEKVLTCAENAEGHALRKITKFAPEAHAVRVETPYVIVPVSM